MDRSDTQVAFIVNMKRPCNATIAFKSKKALLRTSIDPSIIISNKRFGKPITRRDRRQCSKQCQYEEGKFEKHERNCEYYVDVTREKQSSEHGDSLLTAKGEEEGNAWFAGKRKVAGERRRTEWVAGCGWLTNAGDGHGAIHWRGEGRLRTKSLKF